MTLAIPRPRLVPIRWGEIQLLPKREPLIEGVFDVGAMSALVGASGAYKTGIAVDWAGHVGTGVPWRGHSVRKGVALYLAVEGGRGIPAKARLDGGRQCDDRLSVGGWRRRQDSALRDRTHRHAARRDLDQRRTAIAAVKAGDPNDSDRVHTDLRSSRQRVRREPQATRRQHHRVHAG